MAGQKTRMGFSGLIYHGTAGSTAATKITNAKDIGIAFDIEEGQTTTRGESDEAPIEYTSVTRRKLSVDFQMANKDGDLILAALLAAAYSGQPVALRLKDKAAGKGPDGDFILSHKHGKPLDGEQQIEFTAKPNDDLRALQLYV